jgi:hypothetical protein
MVKDVTHEYRGMSVKLSPTYYRNMPKYMHKNGNLFKLLKVRRGNHNTFYIKHGDPSIREFWILDKYCIDVFIQSKIKLSKYLLKQ